MTPFHPIRLSGFPELLHWYGDQRFNEECGSQRKVGDLITRNPPWIRDELILALDLYMRDSKNLPGKDSRDVAELSEQLNLMAERFGTGTTDKYRNTNGVSMKLMNFRRLDPEYTASGKVGLTRGNKEEERVWEEFSGDRSRLHSTANAIKKALQIGSGPEPCVQDDEYEVEAQEGRVLTRLHRTRERNKNLVKQKKETELQKNGRLACEACGFDFEARYGDRGRGFIEAHHTKPVTMLVEGSTTKLSDLALVCANCHRMIHSTRPWLTMDALRAILNR